MQHGNVGIIFNPIHATCLIKIVLSAKVCHGLMLGRGLFSVELLISKSSSAEEMEILPGRAKSRIVYTNILKSFFQQTSFYRPCMRYTLCAIPKILGASYMFSWLRLAEAVY